MGFDSIAGCFLASRSDFVRWILHRFRQKSLGVAVGYWKLGDLTSSFFKCLPFLIGICVKFAGLGDGERGKGR